VAAAAFVGNVRMWYVMKYVRRKLSLSFPTGCRRGRGV
jgi:hypothetical protein